MSSRTPNRSIDHRLDVLGHGPLLVRDICGPDGDPPAVGAALFEVEGDHDACVRLPAFPPMLVRVCLSVAQRAGVLPASPLAAGGDRR